MERFDWIKDRGEGVPEGQLPAVLERVRPEDTVLAFFCHRFCAARGDRLSQLLSDNGLHHLLELRAFSDGRELWAHRSALGEPFQWRVASEEGLTDADCFETRQTLDIDTRHSPQGEDAYGARRLRTTGGGEYALPIAAGDGCAVLVNYVAYDEDGCAYAADWRVKGFAPQKTIPFGGKEA